MPEFEAQSNYEDWYKKSEIDYIEPFMALWVGFNSWYNEEFPAKRDRLSIEKIKNNIEDANNKACKNFIDLLLGEGSLSLKLRGDLEAFHYALYNTTLSYLYNVKKGKTDFGRQSINFNSWLYDFSKKGTVNGYTNIITTKKESKNPDEPLTYIELDKIYIVNEPDIIFKGLIEAIYHIRNMVFHGELKPFNKNENMVVKYAYELLYNIVSYEA